MFILSLFQWLQSTEIMTFIRESRLTYPVIMSTHLTLGFVIMVTMGFLLFGSKAADYEPPGQKGHVVTTVSN